MKSVIILGIFHRKCPRLLIGQSGLFTALKWRICPDICDPSTLHHETRLCWYILHTQ